MLFKINCLTDSGTSDYYIFDNQTLDIWNSKHVPIYLNKDIRFNEFRPKKELKNTLPIFSKDNPIIGKSDIKTIKLSLGFKCNYKCAYCWQRQFEQLALDATPLLVDSFLAKLKKIDLSKCTRLEFWGGEPLVYWKTLKLLIPRLKQEYPKMDLVILSNGSILTKEMVDFFIEYDVHYGISHDGPAFTAYRDKDDPLDTNLEAIQYLCKRSKEVHNRAPWFSVTLNKYNYKLPELYAFFEKKLGKDCPFYIHVDNFIECASQEEHDKYMLNNEEKQEFFKYALDAYLNNKNPLNDDFSKPLRSAIFLLANKITPWINSSGCDMTNRNVLALNIRGDVLSCHSYPEKAIGNIEHLDEVKIDSFTHWSYRENCKNCPILFLCKGGKICLNNNEQPWVCDSMINWKYAAFLAAWKAIFNANIVSIELYKDEIR